MIEDTCHMHNVITIIIMQMRSDKRQCVVMVGGVRASSLCHNGIVGIDENEV